jgi:Leucine-rich repeat (LRR) protein
MDNIKIAKQIEELKSIQKHPRYYLATYFSNLKRKIHLEHILKRIDTDKLLELIKTIESIEFTLLNKIKPFTLSIFNQENQLYKANINNIKYIIETKLFSNKTILFMKDYKYCKWKDYRINEKTFLLIIDDIYLRKNTIQENNDSDYFDKIQLILYILNKQLNDFINENVINIEIIKQTSIIYLNKNIHQIDSFAFSDLTNLKEINFNNNKIKQINSNTFSGLINLETISFNRNQIETLNAQTFNGLFNLKSIYFYHNKLKSIDSITFDNLINLKEIDFCFNQIKRIETNTFKGLIYLEIIDFSYNQIEELNSNLFNGLINLKEIYFHDNQIKELKQNIFNGLVNLTKIDFKCNKIKNINLFTFNGLNCLQRVDLRDNQIQSNNLSLYFFRFCSKTVFIF